MEHATDNRDRNRPPLRCQRHPNSQAHMKPVIAIAALCLTLLTLPAAADNELATRTRRLGVLVLTGQEVELARVGALVFGNKRAFIPAADESLSDAVFQALADELQKEQRFDIKRLPVEANNYRRLAEAAYKGSRGFFGATLGDAQADIAKHGQACDCDAVLVVSSASGQLDGSSNQFFKGPAWVAYSGLGDEVRKTQVAAYLQLFLVDAASGKVADTATNETDERMMAHSVPVPTSNWPKEMTAIAAEYWPVLVNAFRSDLATTIRRPLFKLGLRPSCTLHYHRIDNPPSRHPRQDTVEVATPAQLPEGAEPAKCH